MGVPQNLGIEYLMVMRIHDLVVEVNENIPHVIVRYPQASMCPIVDICHRWSVVKSCRWGLKFRISHMRNVLKLMDSCG